MTVSEPMLPILTLKLVAIATSLKRSGKQGHISNLRSNIYHGETLAKIGPVDPDIVLLKES